MSLVIEITTCSCLHRHFLTSCLQLSALMSQLRLNGDSTIVLQSIIKTSPVTPQRPLLNPDHHPPPLTLNVSAGFSVTSSMYSMFNSVLYISFVIRFIEFLLRASSHLLASFKKKMLWNHQTAVDFSFSWYWRLDEEYSNSKSEPIHQNKSVLMSLHRADRQSPASWPSINSLTSWSGNIRLCLCVWFFFLKILVWMLRRQKYKNPTARCRSIHHRPHCRGAG